MVPVTNFRAFFTPGGSGQIEFKLHGEAGPRITPHLGAQDMAALLAIFTLGNVTFDPGMGLFATNH